jgi:NADH-quinone oxidoreductase subunit G
MADEKKPEAPAAAPPKPPPGPPAPPPPKNPGFVTAVIDGKEVVVKPGTTVIEAAKSVGVEIPYYCYHKRLSIAANCRMCLVEMSNAPMNKLMPACQMTVAEGVTVKTDTPRVKDQQRAVLEFLLLNHPVDCSICDQAGECKLQDYYMKYDRQPSRLDVPKVQKEKRVVLGPTVVLDRERCILCTRCVRFMREVAKQPQLGVAERGNESFIATFPGQPLDSKYAGNVVDICPVGALTSADFRFRGRVWFMSSARSICTGCARGCNTFLDYLNDTTYRYRPRENEAVNQEWMCDDGRTSFKYVNAPRVLVAREGRGATGQVAARAVATARAAQALAAAGKAGTLGVLLSPVASLEDLLAACKVAKEGLGATAVYAGGRADGWQDDFLKRADQNPNRKGL